MFSKMTPKPSISIGLAIINHSFWGIPHDYGNYMCFILWWFKQMRFAKSSCPPLLKR